MKFPNTAVPGPAFLRSNLIGKLWLCAATVLGMLCWQQIVDWPLKHRITIGPEHLEMSEGTSWRVRLHSKAALDPWDTAFARVLENNLALPRYPIKEDLESAPGGGCFIRGRYIYVRPHDPQSLSHGARALVLEIPWRLSTTTIFVLCAGFLVWTAAILYARNTTVLHQLSSLLCGFEQRTIPWLAISFAAAAFLAAIVLRVYGVSVPMIEVDSKGYLRPALQFAGGGGLTASPDRPFAYPLVLGLLLRAIPDFRAVVVLHSVATLFTAAAIGGLVWRSGILLFRERIFQGLARLAGVLAFALFSLNEGIVQREWLLLPEAWASVYMAIQLLLAWHLTSRELSTPRLIAYYIALCAAGWMLCFTKPNWGLAIGLIPLPLAIAGALRLRSWRGFAGWAAAGVGILACVSVVSLAWQMRFTPRSTVESLEIRALSMVCWHAPMVRPEIERQLSERPDYRYHAVLAEMGRVLDEEFAIAKTEGTGAYPSFGYDPDRLFFKGFKKASLYQKLAYGERTALCDELFVSALRKHPTVYLRKVLGQMALLHSRPYGTARIDRERVVVCLERSEAFAERSPAYLPELIRDRYWNTLHDARKAFAGSWPSPPRLGLSVRVSIIYESLSRAFLCTIGAPMLICAVAALYPRWRTAISWRVLAPVLCVASWASGSAILCALTSAVAHSLEVQRYIDLFLPLTLFSQVIWPLLGLSMLLSLGRTAVIGVPWRLEGSRDGSGPLAANAS